MNLDEFLGRYGYSTTSLLMKRAADKLEHPGLARELYKLADDLESALKSVEGKDLSTLTGK